MKTEQKEFTIVSKPFDWNENMSEIALEDFSMISKSLGYCTAQTIGTALAKLELLEKQGCKVKTEKELKQDESIINQIMDYISKKAFWNQNDKAELLIGLAEKFNIPIETNNE